jgi:RNA recognition motif-containing protein
MAEDIHMRNSVAVPAEANHRSVVVVPPVERSVDAVERLQPSAVMRGDDPRTALILRNLPNKMSFSQLTSLVEATHAGAFSKLQLPMDRRSGRNLGYAFIRLNSSEDVLSFWKAWHGRSWQNEFPNSKKVLTIAFASGDARHKTSCSTDVTLPPNRMLPPR